MLSCDLLNLKPGAFNTIDTMLCSMFYLYSLIRMNVLFVLLTFDTLMGMPDLVAMLLAFLYATVQCLQGLMVLHTDVAT